MNKWRGNGARAGREGNEVEEPTDKGITTKKSAREVKRDYEKKSTTYRTTITIHLQLLASVSV